MLAPCSTCHHALQAHFSTRHPHTHCTATTQTLGRRFNIVRWLFKIDDKKEQEIRDNVSGVATLHAHCDPRALHERTHTHSASAFH
jgi:hypothetical protein